MKQIITTLLLCAVASLAAAQEQPAARVFVIAPQAVAGEATTISYKPQLTNLAASKQITGVIYLCSGDGWSADDLEMTFRDTAWVATYLVPGDCVLLACKFHGDDEAWDSGGRWSHYGSFVSERVNGALASRRGAYVNWGFLRYQPFEQHAVPGYSKAGEYIEDNVMQMWINNEYRHFPESRETLSYFAAKILDKTVPGERHDAILQDVDYILSLPSPVERSLVRAAETCRAILKDEERAREIETLVLERFPGGSFARGKEALRLQSLRDPDEKETAVLAFLERFPPEKFAGENDHYANQLILSIVLNRVARGDYDLMLEYLPVVPVSLLVEFYYRIVQLPLKHELKTHEELIPVSTAIYDELRRRLGRDEERLLAADRILSPLEWQRETARRYAGYYFTHAELLHHAGRHAEALEILEPLKDRYTGSVFNDLYARVLPAAGYGQMVIPFIEACARLDATTPAMLETLRTDFEQKNPAGDFDAYVASLRSADFVENFEQRLTASLIKKKIEPFAIEDAHGQRVDMAKLKGKIIILDFWATWCAPCKAALPGMQVAVDRYKDNPGVAFYFISTLEYDPNYKTVARDFLAGKGYRMDLLYDDVDPSTGKHGALYYKYARDFGMNGIPHKAIIDGDGFLRWSSSGYYGNPLEMANEITFLVNHLLNEKK
jgi:thiol-disulfide isomerase/thioredoxin